MGFPDMHPGSALRFDKHPHNERVGARPIVASFYFKILQNWPIIFPVALFAPTHPLAGCIGWWNVPSPSAI